MRESPKRASDQLPWRSEFESWKKWFERNIGYQDCLLGRQRKDWMRMETFITGTSMCQAARPFAVGFEC